VRCGGGVQRNPPELAEKAVNEGWRSEKRGIDHNSSEKGAVDSRLGDVGKVLLNKSLSTKKKKRE